MRRGPNPVREARGDGCRMWGSPSPGAQLRPGRAARGGAGGRGGAVPQGPVKVAAAEGGGRSRWRWAARGSAVRRRPGARGRATRGPCGGTASTGGLGTGDWEALGAAGLGDAGRGLGEGQVGGDMERGAGPGVQVWERTLVVSGGGRGTDYHTDMLGWGQVQTGVSIPPPSSSSIAHFSAPITCCGALGWDEHTTLLEH